MASPCEPVGSEQGGAEEIGQELRCEQCQARHPRFDRQENPFERHDAATLGISAKAGVQGRVAEENSSEE